VLELLSILCYKLPSLSELEELHLLGISDAVKKVLRKKLSSESFPSNRFSPLLHDGFHANPPTLNLPGEHVYCESQPVLR